MPDFAKKLNIPPERIAEIRAERERLQPLRSSLETLLETYSIADVYGEMKQLLFRACAYTFADSDQPDGFRECVLYVKRVARMAFAGDDAYWIARLEAAIDKGSAIGGVGFLVDAMLEIVPAAQCNCKAMNDRLEALVDEELWYKAQMKKLNASGRSNA